MYTSRAGSWFLGGLHVLFSLNLCSLRYICHRPQGHGRICTVILFFSKFWASVFVTYSDVSPSVQPQCWWSSIALTTRTANTVSTWVYLIMQELQPTVGQRDGECPAHKDELTLLDIEQGKQRNQSQPTSANWITLWKTCKWKGLRRFTLTAHSRGEGWTSDITAVVVYSITAYANTEFTTNNWLFSTSLPLL